jgi:hypothetical protein
VGVRQATSPGKSVLAKHERREMKALEKSYNI